MEIERKFLIAQEPDFLSELSAERLAQGYIVSQGDGTEVRLRRRQDDLTLTVKTGAGMVRRETEIRLTAEQFRALWPLTEGRRLDKNRYRIPDGAVTIELDLYLGNLAGLMVAEVEFQSEQAATAYEPPRWFGREITADERFKNRSLAQLGLPVD